MNTDSIDYLKNLLTDVRKDDVPFCIEFLENFLNSDSAYEKVGSPENFAISFALNRAKFRLESAKKAGKKTFGLEDLISALSKYDQTQKVTFFNLENTQYLGTCFVLDDRILGYEFVLKTGTTSVPGLRPDLLG
ncbi:hypothetical protein V2P20_05560 [Methylobacter sp. Wu1]|uniref:hypothetical protein n=1 Tax=Methylobacter sp. Wu1 TaxID=3119359 RepID=UPI002F94C53D